MSAARKKDLPDTYTTADWEYALQYWHGLCAICEQAPDLGTALGRGHWPRAFQQRARAQEYRAPVQWEVGMQHAKRQIRRP